MQRFQAFKYELMPNGEQQRRMHRFAGSCRYVFNRGMSLQKERFAQGAKMLGYVQLSKQLTAWRNGPETPWLKDSPTHPLQQVLKDLEQSYTNFFAKRAAFPKFKKKGQHESFRYPDPKQIKLDQKNSRVFLPKLGWLRYRNSRQALGRVRNATVTHSCGKWYVSIQTVWEVREQIAQASGCIGIDMGIVRFATFSDGRFLAPLNSFKRSEARLRRYQRSMSRKVKFSNNWKKAKTKVQRLHARIANARYDYLHKASTTISQNHAIVYIEDLQVRSMSRSAAGSLERPGKHVAAKTGLNRAILDQGWGEFRRQLEYKLAWAGGTLIAVPPHHTSTTCPRCNHVSALNRRTQEWFRCIECDYTQHADVVGAINVKERGQRLIACGGIAHLGCPAKQEPAEAARAVVAEAR
jgi:putative transposase